MDVEFGELLQIDHVKGIEDQEEEQKLSYIFVAYDALEYIHRVFFRIWRMNRYFVYRHI
jgi:hypothetical protein